MVTERLSNGYRPVAERLPNGFGEITERLPTGCRTVTEWVRNDYQTVTQRLPSGCPTIIERFPNDFRAITERIPNCYLSVAEILSNIYPTVTERLPNGYRTLSKRFREASARTRHTLLLSALKQPTVFHSLKDNAAKLRVPNSRSRRIINAGTNYDPPPLRGFHTLPNNRLYEICTQSTIHSPMG